MKMYTIREAIKLPEVKKERKANYWAFKQAIKNGDLPDNKRQIANINAYQFTRKEIKKWIKRCEIERKQSPIPKGERSYARSKSLKAGVKYLLDKCYRQIDIARCLRVSRQYVNEVKQNKVNKITKVSRNN